MSRIEHTPQQILDRMTSVYPETEIVTVTEESRHAYTYEDFYARVCQVAHSLEELNLGDGAVVSALGQNSYRHLELYFGPPCAGHPLHMCNPHHPDEHLVYMLNNAETEVLFLDPEYVPVAERIDEELDSVEQYVVLDDESAETDLAQITDYERLIEDHSTKYDWPSLDESRTYGIGFTSGTTGRPKGMEFSHGAVLQQAQVAGHSESLDFSCSDTIMLGLHMYYPMSAGFLTGALYAGAELVLPTTESPAHNARVIDQEGVTGTQFATPVFLDLYEHATETEDVDLSSLEEIKLGGDPPDVSIMQQARDTYSFDIVQTYGQTEALGMAFLSRLKPGMLDLPVEEQFEIKKKAGLPHPGINARVRDLDGAKVPEDGETIGELELRGQWVIEAYAGLPEKNKTAFTDDGWFKTGDMATVDENNYIDIVDRKEDMIERGNEWISSSRVQTELMAHEAVEAAVVLGVPHEEYGERPLGVIVPASGDSVPERDLQWFLSGKLPASWIPDEFTSVNEIPRTSVGKFDKGAVKEKL